MKKIDYYQIISNKNIADATFKLVLKGDTSWIHAPGQFLNITINNMYLKRPISICDYDENTLTLIYKVVGKGTDWLSKQEESTFIECLTGLGNGYKIFKEEKILVVGGGLGVPPLYNLVKKLKADNKKVIMVLGFNSKKDVFLYEEFKDICDQVYLATMDGSFEEKGNVIDLIKKYNLSDLPFYSCGPEKMMMAVIKETSSKGQISLEERMGCGFGACMGCSHKTNKAYKRVCVEGPVFRKEELLCQD